MRQILITMTIMMIAINANCQTYTLNLQKYWWYRYRLINDFMKVGSGYGESIPIEQRRADGIPPNNLHTILKSGDALQKLGNYLVLLATEYKMLSLSKLSSGRTKIEIYYALNALNRLDSNSEEYYRHWNDPVNGNVYSTINHPIQNNIGMVPHLGGSDVWQNDFNGHYIRDDINEYFVSNNSVHFNRTGLCDDQKVTKVSSDFTIRNNEDPQGTLSVWLANNLNPRVPVEISLDQATELIKCQIHWVASQFSVRRKFSQLGHHVSKIGTSRWVLSVTPLNAQAY